ncbi:hypothetical protein [Streptomyces sp. KL116D]|uniref:hypothetical protein n=1 Tax=Streptomyces sp. KL116D TaxID=3045152 RepID=UPI0035572B88
MHDAQTRHPRAPPSSARLRPGRTRDPRHRVGRSAKPRQARALGTYRAAYHFTIPDNWKNDPQRPIWVDGAYACFTLYNADYITAPRAPPRRLATSTDLVTYTDRGVALPRTRRPPVTPGRAAPSSTTATPPPASAPAR